LARLQRIPWRRVRTPTRLQMEATECGAAALASILEYHGTFVPLSQLREECGVSRDGSKASNVLKAARQYGFEARGFRKEPHELRELTLPAIVHWNFNHFLVVEGFSKSRVYLNDPASGPTVVSTEEFEHSFTGVVLTFQTTPEFRRKGRRPSILRRLLRLMKGSRRGLAFIVLSGSGLVLPGLIAPVFSMVFVDEILVGGKGYWLPMLLLGMVATAAIRALLTALQRNYLLRLLMKLGISMSSEFMWHALRLPVGFYFSRSPGDLANRVNANHVVASTIAGRLAGVALDLLLVVFYGTFMVYLDARLSLIGMVTIGLHLTLLRATDRAGTDLSRQVSQHAGRLAGVTAGGLQMIETIKASGSETEFFAQWAGHQAKLVNAQQTAARRDQVVLMATQVLSRINSLLVLGFGALRIMDGHLSVGALVAFQSLMINFLQPVERLARSGSVIQQLRGDMERLDDVLEHKRDPNVDGKSTNATQVRRLSGSLALSGVTFGYLPFSPPLVSDLDLYIAPGQRVALVGGTGNGKSTIAKLVSGLYEPWSGVVLLDGEPRTSWPRASLIASVAMVDQDIALFEGTVRDNITLWDETISEIDVVQAAKDACIHDDIAQLQGGYDARVTEGGFNFSGGQRQRLEIARALVRQPALMVLDEATSALDPETERQVDDNLRRRGCSCLIVAHRLSTIRDADEIIVLEEGQVVQRGSHERLMAQAGTYRKLIGAG